MPPDTLMHVKAKHIVTKFVAGDLPALLHDTFCAQSTSLVPLSNFSLNGMDSALLELMPGHLCTPVGLSSTPMFATFYHTQLFGESHWAVFPREQTANLHHLLQRLQNAAASVELPVAFVPFLIASKQCLPSPGELKSLNITPTWLTLRAGQSICVPGDVLFLHFSLPGTTGVSLQSMDLAVDQLLGGLLPRRISEHFALMQSLLSKQFVDSWIDTHFPVQGKARANAFNQVPHRYACAFLTNLLGEVDTRCDDANAEMNVSLDESSLKTTDFTASRYWILSALARLHSDIIKKFMQKHVATAGVGYEMCACRREAIVLLNSRWETWKASPPVSVRIPDSQPAMNRIESVM